LGDAPFSVISSDAAARRQPGAIMSGAP